MMKIKKILKKALSVFAAFTVVMSSFTCLLPLNATAVDNLSGKTTKIKNIGQRSISYYSGGSYSTYFDGFKDGDNRYVYCIETNKASAPSGTTYKYSKVLSKNDLGNASDEDTPTGTYVYKLMRISRRDSNKEKYKSLYDAGHYYTAIKLCIQKYPITTWGSSRSFSGVNKDIYNCAKDLHAQANALDESATETASISYTETAANYISTDKYIFTKGTVSGKYDSFTASVTGSNIKVGKSGNTVTVYAYLKDVTSSMSYKLTLRGTLSGYRATVWTASGYQNLAMLNSVTTTDTTTKSGSINSGSVSLNKKITVYKQDGTNFTSNFSGVEFTLRNTTTDKPYSMKTDSNGNASLSGLPFGKYELLETSIPDVIINGVNIIGANVSGAATKKFELTTQNNSIHYNLTNAFSYKTPDIYNKIKLIKKDSDTENVAQGNAVLTGATYGVYSDRNCTSLVDTIVMSSNEGISGDLPEGTYYVKEITPPAGYTLSDAVYPVSVKEAANPIEISVYDAVIKGNINISKVGDRAIKVTNTGSVPLEDITFNLYLQSNNTLIKTATTDSEGNLSFEDIPYGVYRIEEVVPTGYYGAEDIIVNINNDKMNVPLVVNNTAITSDVIIRKYAHDTQKRIEQSGIEFKIKCSDGSYYIHDGNDVFSTNSLGEVTIPDMPYGEYEIEEITEPYGYQLNAENIHVSINESTSEVVVNFYDEPITSKIQIFKKGEQLTSATTSIEQDKTVYTPVFENKGLQGAVFEIKALENISTLDGTLRASKDEVVNTITTGEDGYALSKSLYPGKYVIKETSSPAGFVINAEEYQFEIPAISYPSDISIRKTFENTKQKVNIEFNKTFEKIEHQTIKPYKNTLFGLYSTNDISVSGNVIIPADSLLEILPVDSNGKVQVIKDLPISEYYVSELKTEEGYELNQEKYPCVYETYDSSTSIIQGTINNNNAINNKIIRKNVKVVKTVDHGSVENIEFTLLGQTILGTEINVSLLTDENGECVFTGIPYGDYKITETVPTGYENQAAKDIKIDFSYNEQESILFENKAILKAFKVIKTTNVNDSVEGFEFSLTGTTIFNEDVSLTATTNANGEIVFENLLYGNYTLTEVLNDKMTPYDVPEAYNFVIDDNSQGVTEYAFNNKAAEKSVLVKKTVDTNDTLDGFEFRLTGTTVFGDTVDTILKTDEKGEILFSGLLFGEYTLTEIDNEKMYPYVVPNSYSFSINAESDEVIVYNITNDPEIRTVKVQKSVNCNDTLDGFTFELKGKDVFGNEVLKTLKTNEDGIVEFTGIYFGEYVLSEVRDEKSYPYISAANIDVVINDKTPEIHLVNVKNTLDTKDIKIIKTVSDNKSVKGFEFVLKGKTVLGETISLTAKTNKSGIINFKNIPYGTYTIEEKENSKTNGYALPDSVKFKIDENSDDVIEFNVVNEKITSPQTGETINVLFIIIFLSSLIIIVFTMKK